jgi:hypothetical protein
MIYGVRELQAATGGRRKLHNQALNDLNCPPNIVWAIKSRRTRWFGHVARMGGREMHVRFCWVNLKDRDCLKNLGGWWEDNIKIDVKGMGCGVWTGLMWLKTGVAASCQDGNEQFGCPKCGEFCTG